MIPEPDAPLTSNPSRMKPRIKVAIATGAAAGLLLWLYLFNPSQHTELFIPCPFHAVTGFDCPGCGTTRAAHHILHGDFASALRANPLSFVILPLVAWVFFSYVARDVLGRNVPELRVPAPVIVFLAALIMAFWIWRNLPSYPFH